MRIKKMTFRPVIETTADPLVPVRFRWGDLAWDMSIEEAGRVAGHLRRAVRDVEKRVDRGDY